MGVSVNSPRGSALRVQTFQQTTTVSSKRASALAVFWGDDDEQK
jgi:hypothetical protein